MKKLTRWLAFVLALAMMMSLAACGGKAETTPASTGEAAAAAPAETEKAEEKEPVTISLMIFQSWNNDAFEEILAEIEEEENITVDLQIVPDSEFAQLVQTKAAVGELPDLITQNSSQLSILGAENFADLSDEEWVSRLARPETVTYEGKIMAFPMKAYNCIDGVYYNKAVFENLGIEIPTTYQEFLDVCEKIKAEGNGIIPIGRSDSESWTTQGFPCMAIPFALYPDEEATLEKIGTGELAWTDIPEIEAVVEDLLAIYENGYVNEDYYTTSWATAQEMLANGDCAMLICADFVVSTIASTYPDKLDDIGYFPFPYNDQQLACSAKDVWTMFASKDSENLDAVKRFLNVYSQKKYQDMYYAANPCPMPAFTDADPGNVPQVQIDISNNYLATGKYVYEYSDYLPSVAGSAWWDSFCSNLMAGATGEMTTAEIVEDYQNMLAEIMKANNMEGWE